MDAQNVHGNPGYRRRSGAAVRGERVSRFTAAPDPGRARRLVTANQRRSILGTGPGQRTCSKARASEIPRPSSRETAKPPRWVSGRGGDCRDLPSVSSRLHGRSDAERTEAGPGREQVANRIGPIPDKPRAVTSRVTSRGFWFLISIVVRASRLHLLFSLSRNTVEIRLLQPDGHHVLLLGAHDVRPSH